MVEKRTVLKKGKRERLWSRDQEAEKSGNPPSLASQGGRGKKGQKGQER